MKNKKTIVNKYLIATFILLLIFSLKLAAADMVKGDYSGWKLGEAFADLARKAELNIVGDFAERKISSFKLCEEIYFEEAINLLAKANGLKMFKNDEIWLAVPAEKTRNIQETSAIFRQFEYKSTREIKETITEDGLFDVKAWFPAAVNGAVFSGSKLMLDEMKKLIETIDIPELAMAATYSFLNAKGEIIASTTFYIVNNTPYSVSYEGSTGFSGKISSTVRANYDGIICGEETLVCRLGDANVSFCGPIIQNDKEKAIISFSLNEQNIQLIRSLSFISLNGRIAAVNHRQKTSEPVTQPVNEKEDGFIVISGPQSPLLEEPLKIVNQPLVESIEKLAAEEKISIFCDDSLSGRVSAFCFAPRLDKQALIEAMAKLQGFSVFKNKNGYTVSSPQKIADLSAESTLISDELIRISANEAGSHIDKWLREAGLSATSKPVAKNRLSLVLARPWRDMAKLLLQHWALPLPEFNIGLQIKSAHREFAAKEKISNAKPLKKSWNIDKTSVQAMIEEKNSSYEEGLRLIRYSVNATKEKKERWTLQSTMPIPDKGPFKIFACEGSFPLQVMLNGNFEVPAQESFAPSDTSADFIENHFDENF